MEAILKRPLFTDIYNNLDDFIPADGTAYIYGLFEERSESVERWRAAATNVSFVRITEDAGFTVSTDLPSAPTISLRQRGSLARFFDELPSLDVYIDITGLSHHVWAPLIRFALEGGRHVRVVYVEPADYRYSRRPMRGEIFDLSEKINGISPLPLFATLAEPDKEQVCFIPLLGFEGTRFAFLIEEVDPPGGKVVPIIGVPGFRAEYPFHTYHGNERKLAETRAWKKIRYARANCPFSLFYVLGDVLAAHQNDYIKVAPIGTKPHSLGAVLKCITSSRQIELVYDHPKRKLKRTSGALHCLVYSVSEFLSGNPDNQNPRIV